MEKTVRSADHSFSTRHSHSPGDPSVSLSLDSSPKRGAKGVEENSPAPQGAAPLRGSGAERRRGLQSEEIADREKTECSADHSFPSRHSPDPGALSVSLALDSSPEGGAKYEASPALRAHFARLCAEADALHRADPGFDLDTALRDPAFVRLTAPDVGVPVADAWYALHRREYAETLRRESLEQAAGSPTQPPPSARSCVTASSAASVSTRGDVRAKGEPQIFAAPSVGLTSASSPKRGAKSTFTPTLPTHYVNQIM